MKMNHNILLAFFLALCLTLTIIESFIPTFLPGFKIGLSNIIVLLVIYMYRWKSIITYVLLRNIIYLILFGQVILFIYSISGSILSVVGMYFAKKYSKDKLSIFGVSIIGANLHNIGQLIVAKIHLNIMIGNWIPYFIIFSVISGIITALISNKVLKKIEQSGFEFNQ